MMKALVPPGRTPGSKNPDVLLLPCGTTKTVYNLYVENYADEQKTSFSSYGIHSYQEVASKNPVLICEQLVKKTQ